MAQDLLNIPDLEPPMGDLSIGHRLDTGRSVWRQRSKDETGAPKKRIVHQRILRLHAPARLDRVGLRPALGFHKCASTMDLDWVVDFTVRARIDGTWQEVRRERGLPQPKRKTVRWFDLGGVEADAVVIAVTRSGLDGWWTSWNLVMGGLVLEGDAGTGPGPRRERWLNATVALGGRLPRGVTAERRDGTVIYTTEKFRVGFRLDRPGFSFLGLGTEDPAGREQNLLLSDPVKCDQGVQLQPIGRAPLVGPAVRCELDGTVVVKGATVRYDFKVGGQHYTLTWRVGADGLTLEASREARRVMRAWNSSAWTLGWDNGASPSHAVGTMTEVGETGVMRPPVWINTPGYGTWLIESDDEAAVVRSEARRHEALHQMEIKVGEVAEKGGQYRLPAGRHTATIRIRPIAPPSVLREETPAVVRRAWERTCFVAPTFRADIGTLANNGASVTCPICMDTWSSVLPGLQLEGAVPGAPDGNELLRISIERWLAGGPGYAAGRLSHGGAAHDADDEYLMTGTAILRAMGDYLSTAATPAWFRAHRTVIKEKIAAARERDLDGDGLIESPHRTGTSGSGQWSTCWLDVLSFGWKCAWSNAILYGALRELSGGFARFGDEATAEELRAWAKQLKAVYRDTFWVESSGWLAGWRCAEDKLHDHAFLPVNGTAVREGLLEPAEAKAVMRRLLAEMKRVRMPSPALGLPMNLWSIPDEDRADILQGYPFGYYQNGGRTHSQTRHFVMGLYAVGLAKEADRMLEELCIGFAEAATFGGNQTGVDWRTWDDMPCGYEGLLTDQFGLLEAIHWRWSAR